jgi:uncharacterized protein (TIGR02147 family)
MISIFDYLDYREFLRDFYVDRKKSKPFFSYRFIARRVGMDSSYLIKVLQGVLHISPKKISDFIKTCELNGQEAVYFENLVYFNKAKTDRQRKLYFEKLFSISKVKSRCLDPLQYEFFQKWYYSAVWSLIQMRPFDSDYDELASLCAPRITRHEARCAVALLKKLGLVRQSEDGRLTVTENNITTGERWQSVAISGYQREMILRAGEAIDRFKKTERDVSSVTLTIPENALDQVRELIMEFRRSVIGLANDLESADRAFQLNVQFYPLTRPVGITPESADAEESGGVP